MKEITRNQSAVIAGIGLLLMAVFAIFATSNTINLVSDTNIQEIPVAKLRLGIFFFVLVAVLDIVVAWALYIFLKPINKSLSLLAALFRLIYSVLLFASLFGIIQALSTNNFSQETLVSGISRFNANWEFSLIIFSLHLIVLGYLLFKAGYMKHILGILVLICGAGYLFDGLGKLLFENYNFSLTMFTFVGEVVLLIWLLTRGRKVEIA